MSDFRYYKGISKINYTKSMEYMQVKVQSDEKKITKREKNLVSTADAFAYGRDLFFFGKDRGGILKEQQCYCGCADGRASDWRRGERSRKGKGAAFLSGAQVSTYGRVCSTCDVSLILAFVFPDDLPPRCILAVLISACYAATDEFHQLFVPGRSGEVRDVLVDTAGAVIGILFLSLLRFIIIRKKKKQEAVIPGS